MHNSGIVLIDKPQGITSHDCCDIARKKLRTKQVGHAGTLDPLASGLLIILVGRATKQFNYFADFDKEYIASLRLGESTDTGDSEGKVIDKASCPVLTQEQVVLALKSLEGKRQQVPPMVSALKHKGKPLYALARKGITVERKPRLIEIKSLKILNFSFPDIEFVVTCSKGTYVRTLGEEIAKQLNGIGHIFKIRRMAIGPYTIQCAKDIYTFDENDIRAL